MFQSLTDDLRHAFSFGNMVTRLIIINVGVFVITALTEAFLPTFYKTFVFPYIALPGQIQVLLHRPWTLVTHMFVHQGMWHLLWNMLTFYWFGAIAGDLLGDKKIWPVYLMGGLAGSVFFLVACALSPFSGSQAVGASAAILAIVFMAVATAPEYRVHLILVGPVRIKFIGLIILFLDLIGTQSAGNAGGHLAHLGGSLFGFLYVYLLRAGTDLSAWSGLFRSFRRKKKGTSPLTVAHRATRTAQRRPSGVSPTRVDEILEKIKRNGYESLSAEEKETLYQASKQP